MIEIKNFNVYASGKTIVQDFSRHWQKGSINAVVGPNGCGKTTLFKGICNLNKNEGLIYIAKKPVNITGDILKYIAAFLEGGGYYTNMTAYQNLNYICLLNQIDKKEIERTLELVRFPESHIRVKTSKLSLGQKQKLGLAMILILDREILLLDEPLNGLDVDAVDDFNELLVTLAKQHQKTIVITSHLITKLAPIIDTISIIKEGKTVYQGNASDVDDMFLIEAKNDNIINALKQNHIQFKEAKKGILVNQKPAELNKILSGSPNISIKPIENIETLYKLFTE